MDEIDFVITVPEAYAAEIAYANEVRQTHGVLIDIVLSAKKYIVLSAPYLRNLKIANPILNGALITALKSGVNLHVISTEQSFDNANIKQYSEYKVHLYIPNTNNETELLHSHAKFCLSDGRQVYLGSANFTVAGLNANLEMGIYSKGELAKQVESFWLYLLEKNILVEYKANNSQ